MKLSFNETMTNVIDHSTRNDFYVCAWVDQRKIRLCIADLGIGIRASLCSSGRYQIKDDYEAIRESVKEGVSSRPDRAGLGLMHILEFIKVNKGQLCIISGNGKVFWKYDQSKIQDQKMPVPFQGTIIKLLINIDKEGFYFLSNEDEYLF